MRSPFRMQTLTARVTALTLIALALITLTLGLTAYWAARDRLQETALAGLEALGSARQSAIEAQLDDYLDDLRLFTQPRLEADVDALLAATGEDRVAPARWPGR